MKHALLFPFGTWAAVAFLLAPVVTYSQTIVDVTSGSTTNGSIGAAQPPGGLLGGTQYRLNVPAGAASMLIRVTPSNASADLDFAARLNQPVTIDGNQLVSDVYIHNDLPSGIEETTVNDPQSGAWYIGILNFTASQQSFQLFVQVTGGQQPTSTPTATTAAPTATPTPTPQPAGSKVWSAGSYQASPGSTFDLLLRVDNAQGIAGGECQVQFSGSLLSAGQAQTDQGTNGFRIRSRSESGSVQIAFANATGAAAAGNVSLVRIPMTVSAGATAGQTSNLTLVGAALYDTTPAAFSVTAQNGTFQVTGGTPCDGDADGNGFVNFDDYRSVRTHFGESNPTEGDANHDGFVNFDDYRSVRQHFGENCP